MDKRDHTTFDVRAVSLASRPFPRRVALALTIIFTVGFIARAWAYRATAPIRYELNQRNAFYWGDRIVRAANSDAESNAEPKPGAARWADLFRSFLATYDDSRAHPPPAINTLDYAPLRLLMAAAWVNYLNIVYGPVADWQPPFARSFATFSMVMELAGAAAMFALVARYLKRCGPLIEFQRSEVRGWSHWHSAAAAASAVWLNPASIVDSHVWPHCQTWLFPFYLGAVLALLEGRTLLAGAIWGIGAMFKGQMLIIAPVLLLWPMFDRRFAAAARVAIGMCIGIGAIVWPWLIRGSFAWLTPSLGAAGYYSDVLRKGTALNFPAILEKFCDARLHERLLDARFAGVHLTLELRTLLIVDYLILLICCTWGIARQARNRDPRLLVSIAAPWALMFFILGQMDERYLVWAATFSAGAFALVRAGRAPRTALAAIAVHVTLTLAAVATMLEFLFVSVKPEPTTPGRLARLLIALNPATLALTAAAVAALFVVALRLRPDGDQSGASTWE